MSNAGGRTGPFLTMPATSALLSAKFGSLKFKPLTS
jgi:hypothetical protein